MQSVKKMKQASASKKKEKVPNGEYTSTVNKVVWNDDERSVNIYTNESTTIKSVDFDSNGALILTLSDERNIHLYCALVI